MKIMAVNGSPRKTWNTATLLKRALKGAASQGADTELIHLYDLRFTGCTSCFACKITELPTQRECLAMLGCYGKDKANKFAEIVVATVLAGDISLMSAIVAGE